MERTHNCNACANYNCHGDIIIVKGDRYKAPDRCIVEFIPCQGQKKPYDKFKLIDLALTHPTSLNSIRAAVPSFKISDYIKN